MRNGTRRRSVEEDGIIVFLLWLLFSIVCQFISFVVMIFCVTSIISCGLAIFNLSAGWLMKTAGVLTIISGLEKIIDIPIKNKEIKQLFRGLMSVSTLLCGALCLKLCGFSIAALYTAWYGISQTCAYIKKQIAGYNEEEIRYELNENIMMSQDKGYEKEMFFKGMEHNISKEEKINIQNISKEEKVNEQDILIEGQNNEQDILIEGQNNEQDILIEGQINIQNSSIEEQNNEQNILIEEIFKENNERVLSIF